VIPEMGGVPRFFFFFHSLVSGRADWAGTGDGGREARFWMWRVETGCGSGREMSGTKG